MNQSNFTLDGNSSAAASTAHQASGQSIFWALVSLAINAMLQPSFTGYCWSDESFESSLWPHRSSPFVCIVDVFAELICWARNRNDPTTSATQNKPASRGAVTLQLVVFFLGVVPQAIKLFCVRGILGTQFMAMAFLISSLPSVVCSIRGGSPNERVAEYVNRLSRKSQSNSDSILLSMDAVHTLLFSFGIVPHIAVVFSLIDTQSDRLQLPLSQDAYNLFEWISAVAVTTWVMILPTASLFGLFRVINPASLVLPTTICAIATVIRLFSTKWRCVPRTIFQLFMDQVYSLAFLVLVSFAIAYTLHVASSFVMAKKQAAPSPEATNGLDPSSVRNEAQSIELQQLPARIEDNNRNSSRTYINTGVQTIDVAGESGSSAVEAASIDITDASSSLSPNKTAKQSPPKRDELRLEPWEYLGIYWAAQIFHLKPDHFETPKTFADKATQTGSNLSENAEVPSNPATEEWKPRGFSLIIPIIVVPILYTAKYLGPLYLATISLGKRNKPSDNESATRDQPLLIRKRPTRSIWKTILLCPPWLIGNFVSALFKQYAVVGNAIGTMFHLHDGEVVWIAFGSGIFSPPLCTISSCLTGRERGVRLGSGCWGETRRAEF